MKATIDVPDEIYRRVKAKSALQGRAVRDVAVELFRGYLADTESDETGAGGSLPGDVVPAWFGVLRHRARRVADHRLDAIRESIARGTARERFG